VGLSANQRETGAGIDPNRAYDRDGVPEVVWHRDQVADQRYDIALCLHEDWEADGFYTYELRADDRPSIAGRLLATARPICGLAGADEIDGRPAREGLIVPGEPIENILVELDGLPEAIWLYLKKTPLNYTLETPSNHFDLATRARCQAEVVRAAIETLAHV
jgi:hypothetical protein